MAEGPETLRDCSRDICQLPSLGQSNETLIQQAPVTDGSFSFWEQPALGEFSYQASLFERRVRPDAQLARPADLRHGRQTVSHWFFDRAARQRLVDIASLNIELYGERGAMYTPEDPLSGLPLPLLPVQAPGAVVRRRDFNHMFHPAVDYDVDKRQGEWTEKSVGELSLDELSRRALRVSIGQDVERWLHEKYHDVFIGPRMPETVQDRFARTVLACAQVIPRQAIDLTNENPSIVTMSSEEYRKVYRDCHYESEGHATAFGYRRAEIGAFLARYSIDQNLEEIVSPTKIDEFLHGKNEVRRLKLGLRIIDAAIVRAVEPIAPTYREAIKEHRRLSRPTETLDATVRRYFLPSRMPEYFTELGARLVA